MNDKKFYLNNICNETEQHTYKNETRDMFRKIKEYNFSPRYSTIRTGHLTNKIQMTDHWKCYCKKLMKYNTTSGNQLELELRKVTTALKKLKPHRSPRVDSVVAEILQVAGYAN